MSAFILNWGKEPQLQFANETEFYRALGQLTNKDAFTISFEQNKRTGSYSDAYRIKALAKATNITNAFKKKMTTANRINCNEYVKYLIDNYGFKFVGNKIEGNFNYIYNNIDINFRGYFVQGYCEVISENSGEVVIYSTEKMDVSNKELIEQSQPKSGKINANKEKNRITNKRDYIDIQIKNYEIGEAGELLVKKYEEAILKNASFEGEIDWVSRRDDSLGYDIKSYDVSTGKQKFIEVKTTSGDRDTPFYISENEINCSRKNAANYYIYRVYNLKNSNVGRINFYIISGDITNQDNFEIKKINDSLVKVKKRID